MYDACPKQLAALIDAEAKKSFHEPEFLEWYGRSFVPIAGGWEY